MEEQGVNILYLSFGFLKLKRRFTEFRIAREAFSHIDFSVNRTGIPINKHTDTRDEHYKVWCLKGDSLTAEVWAELVGATLDAPFRSIFMETIGSSYTEDE